MPTAIASDDEDLDPRFCPSCGSRVTPYARTTTEDGTRIRYRVCRCGAKWRSAEVRITGSGKFTPRTA